MKICLLISGKLGEDLLLKLVESKVPVCAFTDKGSTGIIRACDDRSIPRFVGNPRAGRGAAFIKEFAVDVIVSVNYLFLIESDIFSHAKLASFNVHGSLLPKYRGRTPHVWAIINNEKQTGITAHLIDDGCDTGPIIRQKTVEIEKHDTGASILQKFTPLYHELVFEVLAMIAEDKLNTTVQDNTKATVYGKRTPYDGQINWNWQWERIQNWIRAQADPYPGAFSYLEGEKIIIDKVEKNEIGFDSTLANGYVLSVNPVCIKTPNGALELVKIRPHSGIFQIGKVIV